MGADSFLPPTTLPPPAVRTSHATPVVSARYSSPRARLWVVRALLAMTSLAAGAFAALGGRALGINDWTTDAADRALDAAAAAGVVASLCFALSYVALAVWCGRLWKCPLLPVFPRCLAWAWYIVGTSGQRSGTATTPPSPMDGPVHGKVCQRWLR